jgi:hypothetical protein
MGEMEKRIRGASHVPSIQKGVYNVGGPITGRMGYNTGPLEWKQQHVVIVPTYAAMELEMLKEFFGESMCGDCISTKVTGGHDRNVHNRRRCQLCGTLWPGLEPDNDRRGAIEAQKARKISFHCSSCQDVGCALCL